MTDRKGGTVEFKAGWIPGRSGHGLGAREYSFVESLEWEKMQNWTRRSAGRRLIRHQ